ncbi:MAG: aminoacetone oxidase family FAD-binding enzyme [Prevotella sp.]|nr:aminoacetone oxidase family FAD-binding enzyme [Prevotella sp.]
MKNNIAIIGAGAAGCFAAINIKRRLPSAQVTIYEAGTRPLAKLAVTGGGRCNLTNSFAAVNSLETVYPRGHRLMKRLLHEFSHDDAFRWFEREGVSLVTQDDNCVFPRSQNAMEIVNLLLRRCRELGITIMTACRVTMLEHADPIYIIRCKERQFTADTVVVATGGSPRSAGMEWLAALGLDIIAPVPSLFSLALDSRQLNTLSGTVVQEVTASLAGTKFRACGPLLITHWGVSGPAVLKLSSLAARHLADHSYTGTLAINWLGDATPTAAADMLRAMQAENPNKQLQNIYPNALNARLWAHLLAKAGLNAAARWSSMGSRQTNRLADTLTNDHYPIAGKNRHKDEFVTCGGVALSCLSPRTLECKTHPRLYFIGEATDVDAITGGFNLQAAWTMAYVAAKSIGELFLLNK